MPLLGDPAQVVGSSGFPQPGSPQSALAAQLLGRPNPGLPSFGSGASPFGNIPLSSLMQLFKRTGTPDPTQNLAYNTPNAATALGGSPQLPGYD